MKTYFIIDGEKKEILDYTVVFEEGEKILIEREGIKQQYTITSAQKTLYEFGGKYDVALEIQLLKR